MWLAYVGERPAYNLTSAVEILAQHFSNLEFDAEHEANYGFDNIHTYDECMEIAKKYEKAVEACNIYLHTSNLRSFLETMKEMELQGFLEDVKKFAPNNLFEAIIEDEAVT